MFIGYDFIRYLSYQYLTHTIAPSNTEIDDVTN